MLVFVYVCPFVCLLRHMWMRCARSCMGRTKTTSREVPCCHRYAKRKARRARKQTLHNSKHNILTSNELRFNLLY